MPIKATIILQLVLILCSQSKNRHVKFALHASYYRINMKSVPNFAHSMYLFFHMVPVIRKINRSYFFEQHYLTSLRNGFSACSL